MYGLILPLLVMTQTGITHSPSIRSEFTAIDSPQFIIPNEPLYQRFTESNSDKKGALISVGTFRSLMAASQGDFSHVFLIDINASVVQFNQKQIEALNKSQNISEFLANLCETPELISNFSQALKGDISLKRNLIATLRQKTEYDTKYKHNDTKKAYLNSVAYVESLFDYSITDHGDSFLTNAAKFNKLKTLATQEKLYSIRADLTGSTTLADISNYLSKNKVEVSVIDISNVMDWIVYHRSSSLSPQRVINFRRNIAYLPLSKDAEIHFTSQTSNYRNWLTSRGGHVDAFGFAYFATDARKFLKDAAFFEYSSIQNNGPTHFKTQNFYEDFILKLAGTSNDLNYLPKCSAVFDNP